MEWVTVIKVIKALEMKSVEDFVNKLELLLYDGSYEAASKCVALTTMLSVITIFVLGNFVIG